MQIETVQLPRMRLACIRHVGPYQEIGGAFGRLGEWSQTARVPAGKGIGIYWDDPRETPEAELKSDACLVVPDDFTPDEPGITLGELPAGEYATYTHRGGYEGLGEAWGRFIGAVAQSGRMVEGPSYEIYVNDCSEVPKEELITELYHPVR
jgi:AraC family transcriptional regulator